MSDNIVIPQSGGGDNVGNFSSSVANTSAVTASATGPTSNGVHAIANSADASAVYGEHTDTGIGVFGRGGPNGGEGVFGQTNSGSSGVYGKNTNADRGGAGVTGEGTSGPGVSGFSTTNGVGVFGTSTNREGVVGFSTMGGAGVLGRITNSNASSFASGVVGQNDGPGFGVKGFGGGGGVFGQSDSAATAVYGQNTGPGVGVSGESVGGAGVSGFSTNGIGVFGRTTSGFQAVFGEHEGQGIGVLGTSTNGTGVHGKGGQNAGFFEGNVTVTGDVILTGADCAEEFDIAETVDIEPGTVVVLNQDGVLHQSQQAYDKRVAGVISGAGDYRPGLILDRQQALSNRLPVALVGKVYCKVDAQYAPIEVGDLLTTSSTPGHAMKADDPFKAFGSVIGKALRALDVGQGLIPILIALQ